MVDFDNDDIYMDDELYSDDFEVVHHQDACLPQQELDKILKWLEPTDYLAQSSEFSRHLLSRAPGTGLWLCDTDRYHQWYESSNHGSLWIKGVPGAGKSVLAASLVQRLKETEAKELPVLFFFFRHIVHANRYPKALMRDWLAQLLPHSIILQGTLQPMTKSRLSDVSEDVLWECLLKGLSNSPKAFCVVDAMDEMETAGSAVFFRRLNALSTFRPDAIKLFMTSRPRQDLQSCLSAASIVHISLEEDRVGKEIEVFISYRLQQAIPNRLENRDALAKAIAIRSRGLFLYARLLIDQLLPRLKDDQDVNIDALPLHLEDMYNQMLARQAKELGIDTQVQVALLACVTHCARPLRLRELAGFLSYRLAAVPKESSKTISRLACHPLLEILEDETVQVIHHSFSEFLLDANRSNASRPDLPQFPVLNPQQIHRELAIACLEINTLVAKGEDAAHESTLRWPFYSYASDHWDHHVSYRKDIIDEDIFSRIEEFCDAHYQVAPRERSNYRVFMQHRVTLDTPLHVAAYTGLIEYTRKLISQGQDLMFSIRPRGEDLFDPERVSWRESPLAIACERGHADVLELIWPADALSLIKSEHIRHDMLNSAVSRGHLAVLKLLLKSGITPKTCPDVKNMREHLHRADTTCLALLLPYLTDDDISYTVCKSASEGRDKALQVILDQTKADATWRTNTGTALYQACAATEKSAGTVECVKLLLPSFPDINARVTTGAYGEVGKASSHPQKKWTVLHALAGSWSDDNHDYSVAIFQCLLEAGADIEARDAFGDTPVLCLFPKSHPRNVLKPLKYLLEAGADVSVSDKNGGGLIHRTLELHLDVRLLEVLVEHGADVNALESSYGTSLPVLAKFWDTRDFYRVFSLDEGRDRIGPSSRREIAEFLTRHGATIEAGGIPVRVLSSALESCDIESFQMLLDSRSVGTSLDECLFHVKSEFSGWRPKGDTRSPLPFIQALVAAGASLETKDKAGATPLLRSVVEKDIFDVFLEAGADRDAEDPCGRGALYHLILWDNWSLDPPPVGRLQELVAMGYNPLKSDNKGNSLLHFAIPICSRYKRDTQRDPWLFPFLQQLIDYGLSTRVTNDAGITPLHCYFDDSEEWRRRDPENPTTHLATLLDFLKGTAEGIDINAQDEEGITPLHMAAISTSGCAIEYVNVLLSQGADLTILTKEGENALHLACRARNTATVGYLLDQAADLVNQEDKEGRTPLFAACASGVIESVASLLRAGAKLKVCDKLGWTPLHACAEFVEEHQRWTLTEGLVMTGERMRFDRYRPYIAWLGARKRRLLGYFDPDSWKHPQDQSPCLLENAGLSVSAVVHALLDAGADVSAKGGVMGITPIELAQRLNCHGMIMALQRRGRIPNQTGWCDSNKTTGLSGQKETSADEVLRSPWSFIGLYDLDDIPWLKDHDANLFTTIKADDEGNDVCQKPFKRIYSFVESVALTGLTEVMEHLGDAAQRYAFPDNPIDKWTLETISKSKGSPIPSSRYSWRSVDLWDPESIKTIGDFLRPTTWEVNPILHLACRRTCPNMEMLRVLLERCGVDVNTPSARYDRGKVIEATTTLHLLASKQAFWHLEAIRYLVSKGADVHAKDFEGKTPLHHACARDRVWAPRFVQLLLELGADPSAVDKDGRTCMDVVKSAEVLRVFSASGLNLTDRMNRDLFLAIGKLNLDMVRMALDAGADVNHMEEAPTYTVEELDWEIHNSSIKDDTEAVPLVGALLYQDYTQVAESPEGRDLRTDIVRLLIERGADLLAPWKGEPVLHAVFEDVMCERKYLEVFFEYPDLVDFNARDDKGRTVFLAASNSGQKWKPWKWEKDYDDSDKDEADEGEDDGNDAHEAEEKWDSTGLFLRMMDVGAEVTAVDNDGNNALHTLLSNPGVQERHILEFLSRPESHVLVFQKDRRGFTPLHHALRILRPATVNALLALGADLLERDPEGFTALHRIAGQCLTKHIASPRQRGLHRLTKQPKDFLASCKSLWQRGLDAGLSIDGLDGTTRGDPPLFHYLDHHEAMLKDHWWEKTLSREGLLTCHITNLDAFFANADLTIRNKLGDTALHVLARNLDENGKKHRWGKGRPDKHDAEVFRFLVGEKGLDPLLEDAEGRSSLDVAAEGERKAILEVFQQRNR